MENIRKGKCNNFGNCSKADTGHIIELGFTEDFVCPDCGNDLVELLPEKSFLEKYGKIVAGVAVVGLLGFGGYMLFSGKGDKAEKPKVAKIDGSVVEEPKAKVPVASVSLDKNALTLQVKGKETLTATVKPDDATIKDVTWKSSDELVATVNNGAVAALKAGKVVITAQSVDNSAASATCTVTVTASQESKPKPEPPCPPEGNTKTYSFGTYTGNFVKIDGKCIPQGQGTMVYNRRVRIARNGNNEIYAESGEKYVGSWANGDIVRGNLYDSEGNPKSSVRAPERTSPYNLEDDLK